MIYVTAPLIVTLALSATTLVRCGRFTDQVFDDALCVLLASVATSIVIGMSL